MQSTAEQAKALRWVNEYVHTTPQGVVLPADELYGPTPYDVNFCFPYLPAVLDAGSIRLTPFIPRLHAEAFFTHTAEHPEDFKYMRFHVLNTLEEFLSWYELAYRRNPANMAYAINVVDQDGEHFAGIISLTSCDPERLTAEISMGIGFRSFRGNSGSTIATALLLRYCLSSATDSPPGLGLRKVGWTAHSHNYPAQALARTVGFQVESMKRWSRLAFSGKRGNTRVLRDGDPVGIPGIDDLYYVMCWDDWEGEGRKYVQAALTKRFESKV
ncbi:hypothetical protein SCHPADRAFT_904421 [Schizopora paradoxa]|uniref:N-acetyltransferase domain-containing protein n=1 Tax=Schizopora paradoxa TaxID=27342 RepID=A0A0H2RNP2_9AGAM|nr:hypothetical protein SCHPADRAFT_904421 [Schizopora paradoxa]